MSARRNPLLALVAAFTLFACTSTLPAASSISQERAMGAQEHDKVVAQYGGQYRDAELNRFIQSVGQRLARAEGHNVQWTFTVLDSNVVNAFALPGGFVYVTRGLVALAKDEAEVAGVMAHEMGHVVHQHSTERQQRSTIAGLLAAGAGLVLGSPEIAQMLGLGSELYVASYSRGQETEADEFGVKTLQAAGYDPFAMATFLETMRRYSQYESLSSGRQTAGYNFFSTHPETGNRVEHTAELARKYPRGGDRPVEPYMKAIDGTIWGDSPENGYIRGNSFLHPSLGIAFTVPQGFSLLNGAQQVVAQGPNGAMVLFEGGRTQGNADPAELLAGALRNARTSGVQRIDINGMPAATAVTQAETQQGRVDARLVAINAGNNMLYRFTFISPPGALSRFDQLFRDTAMSFRRLSQRESAGLQPNRIRTTPVRSGDSVEGFVSRMAREPHPEELFRIINDIPPGSPVQERRVVKVIAD